MCTRSCLTVRFVSFPVFNTSVLQSAIVMLLRWGGGGKSYRCDAVHTHAHVFEYVSGRFGLNPDMVGVQSGVVTLIDQGGPSCMTFPGFRKFIVEPAQSRVLAFLSIYTVG